MPQKNKTALIIGAGPAGLTVAYELLQKTNILPVIVEKSNRIGGMCVSVPYKGNYIDIGGHRYFTKFNRVKKWWLQFLPLQTQPSKDDRILNRDLKLPLSDSHNPEEKDDVMLKRYKLCRIYYLRKFFDYPVSLNFATISGLGLWRMTKIFFSYVKAKLRKIKPEKTAEDFLANTFGRELYQTFFKDYTEKLWGIECRQISADWGRERIRGIYFWEIIITLIKNIFIRKPKPEDSFLYPKFGPGQLWDKVAERIRKDGGKFLFNAEVVDMQNSADKITAVTIRHSDGSLQTVEADYVISSLPVRNLFNMLKNVPPEIMKIANGLVYRNFRSAAILLNKLKIKNKSKYKTVNGILPDTWTYIQESDVHVGRLQMYNNWSPYLVKNDNTVWIGLEYFCGDDDEIWNMPNEEFERLAIREGCKVGLIDEKDVLDITSEKLEKAYPAYFGTYNRFDELKNFTDKFDNLYLIGRNGMHKYINIDHVVLSGIAAADNIAENMPDKENIWNIDLTKILD